MSAKWGRPEIIVRGQNDEIAPRIGAAKLVVELVQLRICGFKECCGIFRLAWAMEGSFGLS
jgi:hypothetical protein